MKPCFLNSPLLFVPRLRSRKGKYAIYRTLCGCAYTVRGLDNCILALEQGWQSLRKSYRKEFSVASFAGYICSSSPKKPSMLLESLFSHAARAGGERTLPLSCEWGGVSPIASGRSSSSFLIRR